MWKIYKPTNSNKEFLVCSECDATIDMSPGSPIQITPDEFDFCPYCGEVATEHGIEILAERNRQFMKLKKGCEEFQRKWDPDPYENWVPTKAEKPWMSRLPVRSEYFATDKNGEEYMRRLIIAYKTDTIEYAIGYFDGYKWMREYPLNQTIDKDAVVAWRILDKFNIDEFSGDYD